MAVPGSMCSPVSVILIVRVLFLEFPCVVGGLKQPHGRSHDHMHFFVAFFQMLLAIVCCILVMQAGADGLALELGF